MAGKTAAKLRPYRFWLEEIYLPEEIASFPVAMAPASIFWAGTNSIDTTKHELRMNLFGGRTLWIDLHDGSVRKSSE